MKCGFVDGPGVRGCELLSLFGPTLVVNIGFDPAHNVQSMQPPAPGVTSVPALVDTGATESCIDSQLATTLSLPIVDQAQVGGVGGKQTVNVHLAQIHVPSLAYTIYGRFAAVHLQAGGQQHVALIGRTFLRQHRMIYNGVTGDVELINDSA